VTDGQTDGHTTTAERRAGKISVVWGHRTPVPHLAMSRNTVKTSENRLQNLNAIARYAWVPSTGVHMISQLLYLYFIGSIQA